MSGTQTPHRPGERVRAIRFAVDHAGTPDADGLIRDASGAVVTVDDNVTVPPGTLGTVTDVDDAGTVHVTWDNGHRVGLLPDRDEWERLR